MKKLKHKLFTNLEDIDKDLTIFINKKRTTTNSDSLIFKI